MTIMRFSCSPAVTTHEVSSYSRMLEAPDAGAAAGECRRLPPPVAANRVVRCCCGCCCEGPAAAVKYVGLMPEGALRRSSVGGLVFDEIWWQHNQIAAWGRGRARCEHAAMTAAVCCV